jgi:hypothetical protein
MTTSETRFNIPMYRVPTDEEMKANTLPGWNAVKPTLLSALHPEIRRLSIPTIFFSIPVSEVNTDWLDCYDGKNCPAVARKIVECGRAALKYYPEGVFFKLDSRSPKDWGITKYTDANIEQLPRDIFSSERMLDDMCVQRHHRDEIVLCFRQWVELGEEYRVFVRDRQIQGISRYDYINPPRREHTPEVVATVEREAAKYLEAINPHFSLDEYVFDIAIAGRNAILIEINPYGLSDPCLFRAYEKIRGFVA